MEGDAQAHVPYRLREPEDGAGLKGHDLQGSLVCHHVLQRRWHCKGGPGHHREGKGTSLPPRRRVPSPNFTQANAWSDTATFLKWWREVFLPFVRRFTHKPVLLLMDGCSSHADPVDDLKQVTVKTYPPGCTSVHQPMDQGIVAKTKPIYRKELLDVNVSTMLVADTLRAQAKERKMKAGTAGLAERHHPHVRDAAELLKKAWTSVTAQDIARSGSNICCSCSCKYSDRGGGQVAWRKPFVSDSPHFSPCCFVTPKSFYLLCAMICSSPLLR